MKIVGRIPKKLKFMTILNELYEQEMSLEEVSWMKDVDVKIREGEIPLTPTIVKKILGEPKVIETFHVTDEKHLDDFKKILGKRNPISTLTYFSEDRIKDAYGIKTFGGIIFKVKGILDFASNYDIMSTVDPSLNRRWIKSDLLSQSLSVEYNNTNRRIGYPSSTNDYRKYLENLYRLIDKYKETIQEKLIDLIFMNTELDGYWNELVVRNIKVQSVAWFPHRVMDKDSTLQNLKSITPNIFTFNNENEMLEWFIKNGGHIETTKFKDEWSKNYDIKSLEKNKSYNIYKILTDKDYLINNINNENFINTLITFDTSDFRTIFSKLKNRNEIFNIIKIFLSMDKFIANYGFNVLNVIDLFLTQFTDNDEKFNWFVNKIFSLPNVYLSSWAVGKLIEISGDNSEKMIDKMLSSKSFLQNLTDASSVRMLYHYSDDKKKVMNIISNNSTTFDEEWWKNDRFLNRDIKYNFL
jgi:hypothetical protein